MKKGGFLRNVLDTIRSNQASGPSGRGPGHNERALEFGGQLKPSHFSLCQVARHGFPEQPTALAFDPVQKIAAIGTKSGALRVFGRPGVDVWVQHEPAFAVTHIKFVINQGAIITVTADESIHLWSLRGPNLRLQFSVGQGGAGCSPQATSPAPTPASNISSVSPQSGSSMTTTGLGGGGGGGGAASSAASPSSFLGQITDTVTGAVDSASDFLSGGGGTSGEFQSTPSPTSDMRHSVSRRPEIIHTLKFQREHITCLHQTLASKWLYIGTERGNVHVANVETFELSGYSIAWNKAIELSRRTHPGAIIHISECPQDTNKLLIGYESGCIVIWDLKQKTAEGRYYHTENLLWLAWHYEGKQFVAAHGDGSLVTWQTRSNARPAQILHPHSKMAATGSLGEQSQLQQQQQSLSTAFARSLNNELYRPINKVEWKITKSSNEPFYLFSGGLPYDGIDQQAQELLQNMSGGGGRLAASLATPSPAGVSPSISPGSRQSSHQQQQQQQALRDKKPASLRSTSLTVMLGKSITVLEMDDAIIDFITICDNSPYDNDTSDPYAVIVLLSNELILLDLTSSGYPSFDSPYPSASLSESPVTCVQYLADCSSDLIPYLYSTSQNVISRAPKKGFSDKEWPINGGEWGQSMQSYPELVLTGHADGTIKFWDMSGVNFDLISKIKTAKLFEKPSKPSNAIFLRPSTANGDSKRSPSRLHEQQQQQHEQYSSTSGQLLLSDGDQNPIEESLFAIEKIEFEPTTKRLLVASAFGQVIQFKLNKKDHHSQGASATGPDLTTILVEPSGSDCSSSASSSSRPTSSGGPPEHQQQQQQQQLATGQWKPHRLFQVRASQSGGSTSGGSSSSSGSHRSRGLSGFQAEIVCITPLLISVCAADDTLPSRTDTTTTNTTSQTSTRAIYCRIPPKITVLAFQATHNILAYAHESGIVLVDIIQKCVIINATLNDLYGGSLPNTNDRDISIQPYATSSILQHHYQQAAAASPFDTTDVSDPRFGSNNQSSDNGTCHQQQQHNRTDSIDNERSDFVMVNKGSSGGAPDGPGQSTASPTRRAASPATSRPPLVQSRYTNSMFQRQMSTNALTNTNSSATGGAHRPGAGPRLFQRQMTASQLFSGSGASGASGQQQQHQQDNNNNNNNNGKKRLLNAARADTNLASSATCLATNQSAAIQAAAAASGSRTRMGDSSATESGTGKKPGKNKRIISRMLSISAIHTSVGSGGGGGSSSQSGQESPGAISGGFHSFQSHGSGGGGGGGNFSSSDTIQANDQTPASGTFGSGTDKFSDSSFRRSRSSSTSSTTGQHLHGNLGAHNQHQQANESILCLAFVDPALAGSGGQSGFSAGIGSAGVTSSTGAAAATIDGSGQTGAIINSSSGGGGGGGGGAGASGQVQSSAGSNHKSLSLNDNYDQQLANGQLGLWLGTSTGSLLLVALQMPDNEDNRILQLQSITAEPLPHASIKLNGQILCITPFTCEARLQSSPATSASGGGGGASGQQAHSTASATGGSSNPSSSGFQSIGSASSSLEGETLLQSPAGSSSSSNSQIGGTGAGATSGGGRLDSTANASSSSFDTRSSLFLAIASEKQARVYQVPPLSSGATPIQGGHAHSGHTHSGQQTDHQQQQQQSQSSPQLASLLTNKRNLMAECDLSESSFACRSAVVHMRSPDECCLVSYLATGNMLVHALPRLRPVLLDADFVPYSSPRISSSMCLSRQGHCLYQPSPGEICKFTVSAQYKTLVNDMMGLLYVPREMPEMPRTNFFKSLFSVSQSARQSDRDELFGEAGKPSRGVAHHSGGSGASSGLEKLKSAAVGTMGHDMRIAREGLDERGEKLSEIEDRTLQMMNQSESYAQAAHQLAQKFKDKKWYQF